METLSSKIAEYQEGFKQKVPLEVQEIMIAATNKLKIASISDNAKISGSKVENFSLPNVFGKSISIYDILEKNDFIVLDFYRGGWCPYCNLELKSLQGIKKELAELNAVIVAVSPQTPDNSLDTKEKDELDFEVLSDTDNLTAKKFGLVYSLDDRLKPIYQQFGIDIPKSNDSSNYEIPMPATYIINKNKEIIYHFIDEDYTKRLEPSVILEQIKNYV